MPTQKDFCAVTKLETAEIFVMRQLKKLSFSDKTIDNAFTEICNENSTVADVTYIRKGA